MRIVLVLLAVLLAGGCGTRTGDARDTDRPDNVSAVEDVVPVVVYDFSGDRGRLRLSAHELHVRRGRGDDVLLAVRALMEVPPPKGQESLWQGLCRPGTGVLAVEREAARVTVRLRDFGHDDSGDATCDLSREGWNVQRQQVAWTVRTATGSTLPVRVVLEDGYEKLPAVRAQERFLAPGEQVSR